MDKEAAMLAALDHENIVKIHGVCRALETRNSLLIVMELANLGDLKAYVKERKPIEADYAQFPPPLLTKELVDIAKQVRFFKVFYCVLCYFLCTTLDWRGPLLYCDKYGKHVIKAENNRIFVF